MDKYFLVLLTFLWFSIPQVTLSQELKHKPRKSPTGLVTFKKENHYLKITYGRPKMRNDHNHKFGYSVPYGKLWRLGDDDATEITLTKAVMFGGQKLEAGTYSLFAIPREEDWSVIVNKELGLWGTYKYKKENDVFRVERPTLKSPYVFQTFSIFLQDAPKGCNLVIIWDRTSVMIPIEFIKE